MGKQRDALVATSKPTVEETRDDGAQPAERAQSLTRELTRVEEANLTFYDAFHKRDIDQMSQIWSRSPHARCVHPGWELVIGWNDIRQSWTDIFRTIQQIDFRLEDIHIEVAGRTAWVNLVAHVHVVTDDEDEPFQAMVVTTNIFEEIDGRWTLVLHHSSNFAEDEDLDEDEIDLDSGMDGNGMSGPN